MRHLPPLILRPTSRRFARFGYSLIELLTVISIIGVLATFSLPKLGKLRDKAKVQNATSRFTRSVMAARQAAIQRGKRAYFKTNGNSIWVTVDTTGANTDSVVVTKALNLSTEYGVTVSPAGLISIEYDPRGVSTQATKQVFEFRHTGSGYIDSLCVSRLGNTIRERCP
jgi:prepilin-type N-terminal cleavage/methylation domain-containing protein